MSKKYNHFQAERINTININSSSLVLTSKHSGSILFLDPSNYATTINLPKMESGLHFKLITKSTSNSNSITIKSMNNNFSESNLIHGNGNGSVVIAGYPFSSLILNSSNQNIGDVLDFICDGNYWYVTWSLKASSGTLSGTQV